MKKINIAFVSAKRYSFYPGDYMDRGLGGSESALVLMSRALSCLGHKVDVYNCCYKPGVYNNVSWMPIWMFNPKNNIYDVVISLRLLEVFEAGVNAPIRAVWIHDESLAGATDHDLHEKVNLWIAVSETQKKFIARNEVINERRWFITRNGLDENIYNQQLIKVKKNPSQMIYCSAPDRGLSELLKMWPRIIAKWPNLKLVITGSWALWGNSDEENRRFFKELYDSIRKIPSIKLMERVKKNELAILQRQSRLMLYPTTFNEMYCISALECSFVGTPIITSSLAAMNERVKDGVNGFLINGSAYSSNYQKEFIDKTDLLLNNDRLCKQFSNDSRKMIKNSYYSNIAFEWQEKFYELLK